MVVLLAGEGDGEENEGAGQFGEALTCEACGGIPPGIVINTKL